MALTKLPKNAIGTGAIDASKIEDGTIQNAELAGSLTGTQLASTFDLSSKTVTLPNTSVTSDQLAGSIANNKLSNSTFTIRGTSRALGDSFSLNPNVDWQSVIVADGSTTTTGSAGKGYFINTTSAAHTFTLPASATRGDTIALKDYAATFATNKLTIARNGHNIQGVANNSLIDTNRASLVLVYVDSTKGWLYAEEHNVANLQGPAFISATGGTITTSGDYKTHTFTGDGSFVVATVGNAPTVPTGGPSAISVLVVAGGGAGGEGDGGGGGGGGVLLAPSYNITSTISVPITVGAGGASSPTTNGSNSIFSGPTTLTAVGGGKGGNSGGNGSPGGSGGGGGHANSCNGFCTSGGSGTQTSVPAIPATGSGNSGGTGYLKLSVPVPNIDNLAFGGGGGGAGGAGSNSSRTTTNNSSGGPGGSGINVTPIFGAAPQPFYGPTSGVYAGGGAGGSDGPTLGPPSFFFPGGTGGPGGGGNGGGSGGPNPGAGTAGTVNTGGGGGGGGNAPAPEGGNLGGAGGKGIVIIRYKFQ